MPKHLVFDVNETLLDVAALDSFFKDLFKEPGTRKEWFYTLQENWLTATVIDAYRPFGDLAKAALVMVGDRRGVTVSAAQQQELVEGILSLPPHGDAVEALELLRSRGFSLSALTNSTLAAAKQQLEAAALIGFFDEVLSVDEVRRYKPAKAPYELAAERLGINTGDFTMVAAHAWDITGAAAAGCRTAFVRRPGKVPNPIGTQADLVGDGLLDVAKRLIAAG